MKAAILAAVTLLTVAAQQPPIRPFSLSAADRQRIEARLRELSDHLRGLTARPVDAALLADAAIYQKAAEFILRFPEEFANESFVADTIAVLDEGMSRVRELETGAAAWPRKKGHIVRGYVSRIDGSVQPYALTIPASYDGSKPMRLDIWQHGTNRTLNEVAFIVQQERADPPPASQDYIQLEPLGRTNVSYRWAGEADLFEALESVQQRYNIDARRIVLRGFSMGGASSWHLGLHHPGRWAAIEAGAGYTETRKYGKRENLPSYQQTMLHYYDAVDWSLNAFNTPTVGYGGEIDAQLQASVNVREQLTAEGFRFQPDGPFRWVTGDLRALFLVGPKTGHAWHPDSKAESNAFITKALETADRSPDHVRFVTYTARFNKAHWLTVDRLESTYTRGDVDAVRQDGGKRYVITTKHIDAFTVDGAEATFSVDGQTLRAGPNAAFEKRQGKWMLADARSVSLRKVHGLQGPVDDAFMDSFLCVRPTGTAWNAATLEWSTNTLAQFGVNFAKWLRGSIRLKDDRAVDAADIARHNLILFGDPGSNSVMARVLPKLPIRWTRQEIAIGGQRFDASSHLPVLIYPNPLNPKRYVVINSGHTFGDEDFRGTNAWLYPRIGDYAILTTSGDIAVSGFFDEQWRFTPPR